MAKSDDLSEALSLIQRLADALANADTAVQDVNRQLIQKAQEFIERTRSHQQNP